MKSELDTDDSAKDIEIVFMSVFYTCKSPEERSSTQRHGRHKMTQVKHLEMFEQLSAGHLGSSILK